MTRNYFRIKVKINAGKEMRMPYDKRVIEFPWHHNPKVIETYPLGHFKTLQLPCTQEIALTIRTLVTAFFGTEAVETTISSYVFSIPLIYAMFKMLTGISKLEF